MKYKISEIASVIAPKSVINNDDEISILLTDSRSLTYPTSTLFFALKTKGNDGHRYIKLLHDRGVCNFVVNEIPDTMRQAIDANFLIVDDTTAALQKLAAHHRKSYTNPLIAITGSRGKTTLKEWLFSLLEEDFEIVRSPRSYNSQIGVPLSLWDIDDRTQLAIIEAGISQCGEMQILSQMINPDTVIFTNIGNEHDSGFLTKEQKALEKALLAQNAKTLIFNADDSLISNAVKKFSNKKNLLGWSVHDKNVPLYIEFTKHQNSTITKYNYAGLTNSVVLPFTSDADLENAVNALAVMLMQNISTDKIAERFSRLHHIGTRLNVSDGVNGCSLIYDAYTCDYGSLWSALDFLCRRATSDKSRTLILSDLRHEYLLEPTLFEGMADLIRKASIDRFIGIGKSFDNHHNLFPCNSEFFNTTEEFMDNLSTSDFCNELILIKGSPEFGFERILENLEAKKHETVLEVNLDSVVKNFNYFRQHLPQGTGIVAMVKASGYGAGSYEIAKTLQNQGAAYLAVAVLDEGIDLRKAGITMPIMVMNPKVVNYKLMFANNLEPEIYNMQMLTDVIREAEKNGIKNYPVHIKLDTGMHRMGFTEEELPQLMRMLNSQSFVIASSTFSHLATADCTDMDDYTLLQLERFENYTRYMRENYPLYIRRHILNSAGILRFPAYSYDMARLGIGLYGVNTLPPECEQPLAVVSTLRTVIISIREWNAGETIGYGRRGVLKRKSRIATIPIGYADGMNRHFGNGKSRVYINGNYAPTIGNICMDACMIDVTDIDCEVGDDVEIFGSHVTVQELADILDTIPYEILTSVSPRVKRIYFRE